MSGNERCTECGATETQVTDGLLYCKICGAQIQNFRLVDQQGEMNVEGFMYGARIQTNKKRTTGAVSTREEDYAMGLLSQSCHGDAPGTFDDDVEMLNAAKADFTGAEKLSHDILGTPGKRIATVAKIIAKLSVMMAVELGFPENYPKQCCALLQRFLSTSGVCYVKEEYTEDVENMFRPIVLNKNLSNEQQELKKKLKARKKAKLEKKMDTNAWDTIMDETANSDPSDVDMNADSDADPAADDSLRTLQKPAKLSVVRTVDTKVSDECMRKAARVYILGDVVVAVLYVSAVSMGVAWVTLSDIVRWIREGRGAVSYHQWKSVSFSDHTHRRKGEKVVGPAYTGKKLLSLPLYELWRTMSWLWQSLSLPPTVSTVIDIDQVASRLLYSLNLPGCMWIRLKTILSLVPFSGYHDVAELQRQGSVYTKNGIPCGKHTTDKFSSSLFVNRQRTIHRFMLGVFGRPLNDPRLNTDVFFTIETKIMACILFSLKLMFGLDGQREFSIKNRDDEEEENGFSFSQWLYQLRMRLSIWDGYSPLDVLQTSDPVHEVDESFHRSWKLSTSSRIDKQREMGFDHCVPREVAQHMGLKSENPVEQLCLERVTIQNDDDAILAPLRAQSMVVREFLSKPRAEEQKNRVMNRIEKAAEKVFHKDYESCSMNYDVSPVENTQGYLFAAQDCVNEEWSELFPCACGYVRLPRPLWAKHALLISEPRDLDPNNSANVVAKHLASKQFEVVASRNCTEMLLKQAKIASSQNFLELLKMFSKLIGEAEHVLYAAFVMVEYQIVGKQRYVELSERLRDGRSIPVDYVIDNTAGPDVRSVLLSAAQKTEKSKDVDRLVFGFPPEWGRENLFDDLEENPEDWLEWGDSSDSGGRSDTEETCDEDSDEDESSSEESDAAAGTDEAAAGTVEAVACPSEDVDGDESTVRFADIKKIKKRKSHSRPEILEERPENRASITAKRVTPRFMKYGMDWDTIWQLITMRYW